MTGNTLTTLSTLQCPHGAPVSIVSSNAKVQLGDAPVATSSDTFSIAGCPFQIPATPPIPSPCVTVQWQMTDTRVQVAGAMTLSQSSVGVCLNAQQIPQGPVVIGPTQPHASSE